MKFEIPKLPYSFNALEPYIDEQTMEIHYTKHHQAYVNKLNEALDKYPELEFDSIENLLSALRELPSDLQSAVRNHGGGHYNHSMFWQWMAPKPTVTAPGGTLAQDIIQYFGSFQEMQQKFTESAKSRFGSGWAWLVKTSNGLEIYSTPNQDNPIIENKIPVMGLDVWEHAYYLKYQNKRDEYIENWWNVVNWHKISIDYEKH